MSNPNRAEHFFPAIWFRYGHGGVLREDDTADQTVIGELVAWGVNSLVPFVAWEDLYGADS